MVLRPAERLSSANWRQQRHGGFPLQWRSLETKGELQIVLSSNLRFTFCQSSSRRTATGRCHVYTVRRKWRRKRELNNSGLPLSSTIILYLLRTSISAISLNTMSIKPLSYFSHFLILFSLNYHFFVVWSLSLYSTLKCISTLPQRYYSHLFYILKCGNYIIFYCLLFIFHISMHSLQASTSFETKYRICLRMQASV